MRDTQNLRPEFVGAAERVFNFLLLQLRYKVTIRRLKVIKARVQSAADQEETVRLPVGASK